VNSRPLSGHTIRQHLDKALASHAFAHADRLKRFLAFVVRETADGRGAGLKEYSIGVEVFDRESSFDPRTDPIVRVQARRLRARLTRYYEDEGRNDEIRIDLPKGGYAPEFHRHAEPTRKNSLFAALASRNTISVMPFSDRSPNGDMAYFCDGISEEIINAVAKLPQLHVIARGIVNAPQAGTLISGSIRRFGHELHITVQIIDAVSGCYLWSEVFDRTADNLSGVQREIATALVEKLKADVAGPTAGDRTRRTDSLSAYNFYLQGRYHCSQRTDPGLRKAVEFFEKSIAEDSRYAPAYSGLADAYSLLSHYGVLPPAQVWTKAASNAASAVLLDDELAEGHTSLAHVKATQDWDWHGAELEYRRAIMLDPRLATAHHWYAVSCLVPLGRLDDALQEIHTAQTLDPVSKIISRDTARLYYYRREFEAALEECDRTIERDPYFSGAYWLLGLVQEQLGDFQESAAAFQRGIQLLPDQPLMRAALGRLFAISGKPAKAKQILREMMETSSRRYLCPFEPAMIHLALRQLDAAFECLAKATEERCFDLISLNADPRFDEVRPDSRLRSIANEMGLI
jgi:TolB-like protein/tetratricopeptide (TPR) repeat protein